MFGQYKRLANEFTGVLTGKGQGWGGSLIRPEATGYGNVYFAANMLATKGQDWKGKKTLISGSGNVAQYAAEKAIELGAKVLTVSDSSGFVHFENGMTQEHVQFLLQLKNVKRGRISEIADAFKGVKFHAIQKGQDHNPLWNIPADCALPCATQNEVNGKDARNLTKNGVHLVSEGSNMSSTPEAVEWFLENNILYAPGKAANAGGVATSGLEMSQNSMRYNWTRDEVDSKLKNIMKSIHDNSLAAAKEYGFKQNYVAGANIQGFLKVVNAMMDQGVV
jgi:glutamate dehydrogenase (NADP+)